MFVIIANEWLEGNGSERYGFPALSAEVAGASCNEPGGGTPLLDDSVCLREYRVAGSVRGEFVEGAVREGGQPAPLDRLSTRAA